MPSYNHIGVIILAGGKSLRMGQDKGVMPLNGKPMIQYVIDVAKKMSDHILISANSKNYDQFGVPVFNDDHPENGPLGGLYTGLKNSAFDYNLVLSCDVPFMHEGVLEFLVDSSTGYDCTIAKSEGKIHPLIGVYRKSCLPVLKKNIDAKKLKVTFVFDELKTRELEMDDFLPENFRNINSPGDL